jgi:hypothetical protein
MALICLRATFGNAANPSLFSVISESAVDLANQILEIIGKIELPKSQYEDLIGEPITLEDHIPFGQARKMIIEPTTHTNGYIDNYLDDSFGMVLWLSKSDPQRVIKCQLLAIDVLGRPNTSHEPLPRNEMLSEKKMKAEGTPTEVLTILGWKLNTRAFTISLPTDKFEKYTRQITVILAEPKKAKEKKELESLVGRIQHVASIIPASRHFTGRLNNALQRAKRFTRLSKSELDDLQLWQEFLVQAHKGMDLNILTPRYPDHIIITDASLSKGMGAFNVKTGEAWRWPIPASWKTMSINTLEFITTIIALEVDLHNNPAQRSDCYLVLTDNTSAMGWLRKTNFNDSSETALQLQIARHFARLLIANDICLCSQHLEGTKNEVADLLSRNHTLSDDDITNKILLNFSTQVPKQFKVRQIPTEITLQYLQKVREWQSTTVQQKAHNNDTVAIGTGGLNSQEMQGTSTHTWTNLNDTNKLNCFQPSCTPSERNRSTPFERLASWHQRHVVSTLPAWQRPLFLPVEGIQGTTWTENYQDFYSSK